MSKLVTYTDSFHNIVAVLQRELVTVVNIFFVQKRSNLIILFSR